MRVVFIGSGDIGLPTLRWLLSANEHEVVGVVTQPDKPVGRTQQIEPPPIKAALANTTIPVLQPPRIKRDEAVAEIRALAPDVIVVMAYGQILSRAVLDIPRVACLNLHASILPRHRGAAPIQAAILAGDAETGITVMYMDEGLDTGDILLISRLSISPAETGGSLHDRLAEIAPTALGDGLQQLAAGNAARVPQDDTLATYAPKLEREHGRLDGSETAETMARKIRAFDPWPGTYLLVHEKDGAQRKLKLFGAAKGVEAKLPPRSFATAGDALLLGAADGAVEVPQAQLEGRRRMKGAELLRGCPWLTAS